METGTPPDDFILIKNPLLTHGYKDDQLVKGLCDLCIDPFTTTFIEYVKAIKEGYAMWC